MSAPSIDEVGFMIQTRHGLVESEVILLLAAVAIHVHAHPIWPRLFARYQSENTQGHPARLPLSLYRWKIVRLLRVPRHSAIRDTNKSCEDHEDKSWVGSGNSRTSVFRWVLVYQLWVLVVYMLCNLHRRSRTIEQRVVWLLCCSNERFDRVI
jgi:hypothetical protein